MFDLLLKYYVYRENKEGMVQRTGRSPASFQQVYYTMGIQKRLCSFVVKNQLSHAFLPHDFHQVAAASRSSDPRSSTDPHQLCLLFNAFSGALPLKSQ